MSEKVQIIILRKTSNLIEALLLQTNSRRGGFWQNVTGGVEPSDKTIRDAVIREVHEETGIKIEEETVENLKFTFSYHSSNYNKSFQEHCYFTFIHPDSKITISEEHQDYSWIDIESINANHYGHESNYQALLKTLEHIRRKKC